MWHAQIETLNDGRVQKFAVLRDDVPLPYFDVIAFWQSDAEFRSFFTALLADSPFTTYRWETPPVTLASTDQEFEFVLLRSSALERPVDRAAFASHFDETDVVTFPNLGGDAVMVVPCPVIDDSIYGHLASFIRCAPDSQVHHLWQAVGTAMQKRLCDRPIWLSTAGMGVSWLHVRLDSQPKYYGYAPFKQFADS
ncbi:MAG: hypothetical protein QGF59_03865 [Pirellulaceae bacterium]|jgi:hypothetical protein|nr:hypothetical protein [Pirellulaceae bacterium]MDP6717761.1 hypothetical protein [Pirellulaceae bacterium]